MNAETDCLAALNLIDLTHTLSAETPHWEQGCGFKLELEKDYADCDSEVKFRVQKITMYAGVGTHIDSPSHCIVGGKNIADISLKNLFTRCSVIDVAGRVDENYSVTVNDINVFEEEYGIIQKNTFVIVYTGWDRFWQQPEKYRNNLVFPTISKEAAELLLTRDIAGLGIDTLSPDHPESGFPVHKLLLGAGKYIIENVANAKNLPCSGAYICALPIKIDKGAEAPIRLIGLY